MARERAEEGENVELSGVMTGGFPMVAEGNRTGVGVAGKSGPVRRRKVKGVWTLTRKGERPLLGEPI